MPRSRARNLMKWSHTLFGDFPFYAETMYESSLPGPCSVYHIKHEKLPNVIGNRSRGNPYDYLGRPVTIPSVPFPDRLNWSKLPSSSEFGLIQFLAELDDTLATFTAKFWKELSYGSFTWGVLPLISDLKALLETMSRLGENLASTEYEDAFDSTHVFQDWTPDGVFLYNGTMEVKYRYTGKASYDFSQAQAWLDRLGLHPDLATAWDLVPLSFVFDWLLPVGDYLESLRQGGWVKAVYFNGWQTAKFTWKGSVTTIPSIWPASSGNFQVTGFHRTPSSKVLVVDSTPVVPTPQLPSLRQLFNMAYIGGLSKVKLFGRSF